MRIKKRKKTFVLIIPRFEDIFHSYYAGEIIKGVSLAASRLRVDVLIHITDRFDHRVWLDSSLLNPSFIDGILFGDIDNDLSLVKKVVRRGIPALVLNNLLQEPVNYVAVDNFKAAENVARHLLELGHTSLATITGDQSTQAGQQRLEGFLATIKGSGGRVRKAHVLEGNFLRSPARAAAQRLLKMKNRPTAVFAASDVMALEVLDVARKTGLRIPQDLSVVGFDDNPLNLHCPLKLTTISQPLLEMARRGMEEINRIALGQAQLPVKVVLPTKLVLGQTTGRVET